ncbi:hypothetical protein LR48_Vigan03g064900 [Vigna angularis]|uniref:Uncharacterized protein n=1 Tax=Phaseolus angularis TaxID=3914 RepID=A0A0L9U367_PHAAN|nr:hypothetical protein LR48_Vigan03g064900 [Vigna angularis]
MEVKENPRASSKRSSGKSPLTLSRPLPFLLLCMASRKNVLSSSLESPGPRDISETSMHPPSNDQVAAGLPNSSWTKTKASCVCCCRQALLSMCASHFSWICALVLEWLTMFALDVASKKECDDGSQIGREFTSFIWPLLHE